MRYPLLLALGVAITLAPPAVAQTVTKPTEKDQKRRQEIERHMEASELSTELDTDSLTDAIERQMDSLREAIEQRTDSIAEAAEQYADSLREVIERRADSLQTISDSLQEIDDVRQSVNDSLQTIDDIRQALNDAQRAIEDSRVAADEGHIIDVRVRAADADSLRAAIRRQMASSREIMGNARELNKQMRKQMQQVRNVRILTRRDTTGMAKELRAAELALASARTSIQPLDSSMILFGHDGAEGFRMEFGDSSAGDASHLLMMVEDGAGDHPSQVYLNGSGANGFFVQRFGTSSNGNNALFQQFIGDVRLKAGTYPPVPPIPATPPSFSTNARLVVIGSDSIHVVDGKDIQTVIRIAGDSSDNARTRHTIVIISSRGGSSDGRFMTRTMISNGTTITTTTTTSSATGPCHDVEKAAKPMTPNREDAAGHTLDANRPNPFVGSTTISFTLPRAEHATLSVYDAHGTLVRTLKDEEMEAGNHSVMFDASGLPSGTYLYRLVAGGFNETKTMTLEK